MLGSWKVCSGCCDAPLGFLKFWGQAVVSEGFPKAVFPGFSMSREASWLRWSGAALVELGTKLHVPARAAAEAGCAALLREYLCVAVRKGSRNCVRGPARGFILPRRAGLLLAKAMGSSE